jgi:dolichol-phosphate mannosyltransferase
LESIHNALSGVNHEIIIVDDDSPDRTWAVAEQLSHKFNNIKVVRRPRKMGLASAFIEGLNHAEGELVGLMDADLQHPPELLREMYNEARRGADIAIASRYVHSDTVRGWPFHRRFMSKGAIVLAHLFIPKTQAIKDPVSGFFLLKRGVITCVQLSPQSFKVLLEILAKSNYTRVIEIPYTFRPRRYGKSKLSFKEVWNYIKHLHRLALASGGLDESYKGDQNR